MLHAMRSDPPNTGDAGAPSGDPTGRFDALVHRAQAVRARGLERASAGDPGPPGPWGRRRLLVLAVVLAALVAGAVIGWVARGDDSNESAETPVATTTTTISPSTTLAAEPAVPVSPPPPATSPSPPSTAPTTPTVAPPGGGGGDPTVTPVVQHTVVAGESFWSIAEHEVGRMVEGTPTEAQVASYWRVLVEANTSHLQHAGNPNLVYPGQVFELPVGVGL